MSTASTTQQAEIGGYSPVSYFEKGRAELGSPEHAVEHDGKIYHVASAEQAKTFAANPEEFLPAPHDMVRPIAKD